jgi:hypothetical protein
MLLEETIPSKGRLSHELVLSWHLPILFVGLELPVGFVLLLLHLVLVPYLHPDPKDGAVDALAVAASREHLRMPVSIKTQTLKDAQQSWRQSKHRQLVRCIWFDRDTI